MISNKKKKEKCGSENEEDVGVRRGRTLVEKIKYIDKLVEYLHS